MKSIEYIRVKTNILVQPYFSVNDMNISATDEIPDNIHIFLALKQYIWYKKMYGYFWCHKLNDNFVMTQMKTAYVTVECISKLNSLRSATYPCVLYRNRNITLKKT